MSDKRKHTFDEYREGRKEARKESIRAALRILVSSNYPNVSKLAKAVAKILDEMALRDWEVEKASNPSAEIAKPKPVSYTTLIRNHNYRSLLDLHMEVQTEDNDTPSVSALELVKIRCASLESQNEILKSRMAQMNLSSTDLRLEDKSDEGEKIKKLQDEKVFLVEMVKKLLKESSDVIKRTDDGIVDWKGTLIFSTEEYDRYMKMTNR